MKIEIWSDIICPFCYIGKRNLELALAQFPDRDKVEILWKSFVLDPTLPQIASDSYADYLVKRKGLKRTQVDGMISGISHTAKQAGLDFHIDKSILVSSYKAHQFIQYAKEKNIASAAEEVLFAAFFSHSKDIANTAVLLELGQSIGLDSEELLAVLENDSYASTIDKEIAIAKEKGINGVPFFLFNETHPISGAQPPAVFLNLLFETYKEWSAQQPHNNMPSEDANACSLDGTCQ